MAIPTSAQPHETPAQIRAAAELGEILTTDLFWDLQQQLTRIEETAIEVDQAALTRARYLAAELAQRIRPLWATLGALEAAALEARLKGVAG